MEVMGDGIAELGMDVLGQAQNLEFGRNLISDIGD